MNRPSPAARPAYWTIPNLLSLLRILLVPFFVSAMLGRRPLAALILFSAAALTDFLDGLTARLLKQRSALGLFLDPVADKLLMTAAFIVCALPRISVPNAIPPVLTVVVVARDVAIALGALVLRRVVAKKSFAPSLWGKASTICQMACLFLVLALNTLRLEPGLPLTILYALTLAVTAASGGHYFWRGFIAELRRGRREP